MPVEWCFDEGAPIDDRMPEERRGSPEPPSTAPSRPPITPSGAASVDGWVLPGGPLALPPATAHSASLLHAVFETVPLAIAVVAVPGFEVLLANRRFDEIVDQAARGEGIVGRRLADLAPAAVACEVGALLEQAAATGEATVVDQPLRRPRGTTYWRLSLSPVRDEAGAVVALVVAGEETTAQVNARLQAENLAERLRATNDQLTQANLRLEAIIGRLPQGVIVVDREGRIVLVNRAAERLLGRALPVGAKLYSLEVARFKPGGTLYEVDELPLPRSLRGETCYGVEIEVKQPGGRVVNTLCSSAPLYDVAGRIVAAVSIFQDITELRELDRLKDEFLSIASHELKNPLTVLKGYVQILLRGDVEVSSVRERQVLTVIDREVNRLSRLINVMLDVSRIQLGGLKLDRQSMDLGALAQKLVEHFQGLSPQHRFVLRIEPDRVEGLWDPVRIEQVLANLVDNAVKYSPKGGSVAVSVRAVGRQVEVAVRDEGVGIPPDEQDRVFQKFYRARSHASRNVGGIGLGLYVCQEIVRAHGGRMCLESEPGRGSTFSFSLPSLPLDS